MPECGKLTKRTDTEQLVALLGTTKNVNEAGFILADGRFLHLQRTKLPQRINHLDVFNLLPRFKLIEGVISDTEMMAIMAKENLIRFSIKGTIHTATQPTSAQMRTIYNVLAYRSSIFEIIISNAAGMTLSQHQVAGPSMSTLVSIYKSYQSEVNTINTDEFLIKENTTHYQLVFRPTSAIVGSINKNSKILKIDREYKAASKLFYRLISQ